jgi:hypothetical protein
VLEVIANQRSSISSRIYPTSFEDDRLRLSGAKAKVLCLNIYQMPSIWPSRPAQEE